MKLFWSTRSPFVRKVMVVAHEKGLVDSIERERTIVAAAKPNPDVMAINPLNKLPTLVLDDGSVLYDSRVIVEYLDEIGTGLRLFPVAGPVRFTALRRQAIGDGLLDLLVAWLGERNRPAEQQSQALIDAYRLKLRTTLDALEQEAGLHQGGLDIGRIAIAAALSYADFRYADERWRDGRPGLAGWHETMTSRPSFKATEHADVY